MSEIKRENLDDLQNVINYFIDQPQNVPGTDFCANVDKLINISSDLHETKANEANKQPDTKALPLQNVVGSALEADYWSERCKLAESIWENSNVEYIDKELADLEKEYHRFIKDNGSKHYR